MVNVPQLVRTLDRDLIVPTYNWSAYFEDHVRKTALKGISKYQHFRFSRSIPGVVHVKEPIDGPEKMMTLLKDKEWLPTPNDLPEVVNPNGLSPEW